MDTNPPEVCVRVTKSSSEKRRASDSARPSLTALIWDRLAASEHKAVSKLAKQLDNGTVEIDVKVKFLITNY